MNDFSALLVLANPAIKVPVVHTRPEGFSALAGDVFTDFKFHCVHLTSRGPTGFSELKYFFQSLFPTTFFIFLLTATGALIIAAHSGCLPNHGCAGVMVVMIAVRTMDAACLLLGGGVLRFLLRF